MYTILNPAFTIFRHRWVSSPGQYGESKPPIFLNASSLIMILTDGQSSTNFLSQTDRYLSGLPPVSRDKNTEPDTFWKNESVSGVSAGPPIAAIVGSLKTSSTPAK